MASYKLPRPGLRSSHILAAEHAADAPMKVGSDPLPQISLTSITPLMVLSIEATAGEIA